MTPDERKTYAELVGESGDKLQEITDMRQWLVDEVIPAYIINRPPTSDALLALRRFSALDGMLLTLHDFAAQVVKHLRQDLEGDS